MRSLEGKTAWVTGASSGIGRELSHQLAQSGARLILSARREAVLEEVRSQLPAIALPHRVAPLDLADADRVFARGSEILAKAGPVDILINAAGIAQRAFVTDGELGAYRKLMEVNYFGAVALTKVVLPSMLERGSGTMVAISSVAGKVGSKRRSGYSGSKFAIIGFMDCLRAETAAAGLHCLTVCPGFVQTDIARNALGPDGLPQQHSEPEIEQGMPVEACCQQILRAMELGKDEVVIGRGVSGWAPLLKRLFPSLFNWGAARRRA